MSDSCLNGLEVSQLHLGGKRKRKPVERTEGDEVGGAWTTVRPDLRKEWDGEQK